MRNHRTLITPRIALLLISALALSCFATSPVAYAGAPFSNPSAPSHDPTQQDLAWLALKNAYRIRSGIRPGQGKGAKTQPFVAATPFVLTSAPSSYELSVNDPVPTTFEPVKL